MKKLQYILLMLMLFLIGSKEIYAYTCKYKSSATTINPGCGEFTIQVNPISGATYDGLEVLYKDNIKFTKSNMQTNSLTVTEGWARFVSTDLNGECPDAYTGLPNHGAPSYENACDIYLGFGDLDIDLSNSYNFEFGENVEDPLEEEPLVPNEYKDEIYFTVGIAGSKYVDVGSCGTDSNPRYLYVQSENKTVIACIGTKSDITTYIGDDGTPNISCGFANNHPTFKATKKSDGKIEPTTDSPGYFAGVCYTVNANQNPDNYPEPDKNEGGNLSPDITPQDCHSLFGDVTEKGTPAYYLNMAFSVIRYAAIILLVALSGFDFISAITSHDADALKKATNKAIIRVVLCVVIFLLPMLVKLFLKYLNDRAMDLCGIGDK